MKVELWNILTLLILLQLNYNGQHVEAQNTRYKVIIVGAGLSGYSAAAKLMENEMDDILVLEAENRTGGRIHSVPFAGGTIDLGAQWLHGQGVNLIYEMIDGNFEFGDDSFENATDSFWQSNGDALNKIQVSGLVDLSRTIRSNVYDPNYFGTYGSYFISNYLNGLRTPEYSVIPWYLAVQVQNFFHSRTNTYFGSKSWFDISIAIYATHVSTSGNQLVSWSEHGSLEKIFLEFGTPFWNTTDSFDEFSILWTHSDISDLVGTEQEWLTEIAYFFRLEAFPNILQTFFVGARIPNFESCTEAKIAADCMWLLRRVVNDSTLPDPINVLRTDWITKRNFLGSYSLFTMDSAFHGATPSNLAEPVYNANGRPRTFFAGEHTSPLFSGYSNGAVETGYIAGEEVLEYSRTSSSKSVSKNLILVILFLIPAVLKL